MTNHLKKIGIALGCGAARGAALIGFLEILKEEGIPISFISGVSGGAIVAAAYAIDNLDGVKNVSCNIKKRNMLEAADFIISKAGLLQGTKIKKIIDKITLGKNFKDAKIPLALLATDAEKMESVVIRNGDLTTAVMASSCIPGLFKPIEFEGLKLIDGGLTDMLPTEILYEMGAEFVIAVDVRSTETHPIVRLGKLTSEQVNKIKSRLNFWNAYVSQLRQEAGAGNKLHDLYDWIRIFLSRTKRQQRSMNVLNITLSSYLAVVKGIAADKLLNTRYDLLVKPEIGGINRADFFRGEECMEIGRKAAREKIDEIKIGSGLF